MKTKYINSVLLAVGMLFSMSVFGQEQTVLVDSAQACVERNDFAQAAEYLKRAIEADPTAERNVLLFINLGSLQRQQGLLKEAVETYSLALNFKPHAMPVLLARAATYLELGVEDKAYVDYSNVLDQDITNKEALSFRAFIAMRQHAYDVARADYERLLDQDAKDPGARMGLALLNQKQGRLNEATEQLARLIADWPKEPAYYLARADVLADRKLYDLALLDYESAIGLNPDDPYAYIARAEMYLQMKHRKKQARKDLDMAVFLGASKAELNDLYIQTR